MWPHEQVGEALATSDKMIHSNKHRGVKLIRLILPARSTLRRGAFSFNYVTLVLFILIPLIANQKQRSRISCEAILERSHAELSSELNEPHQLLIARLEARNKHEPQNQNTSSSGQWNLDGASRPSGEQNNTSADQVKSVKWKSHAAQKFAYDSSSSLAGQEKGLQQRGNDRRLSGDKLLPASSSLEPFEMAANGTPTAPAQAISSIQFDDDNNSDALDFRKAENKSFAANNNAAGEEQHADHDHEHSDEPTLTTDNLLLILGSKKGTASAKPALETPGTLNKSLYDDSDDNDELLGDNDHHPGQAHANEGGRKRTHSAGNKWPEHAATNMSASLSLSSQAADKTLPPPHPARPTTLAPGTGEGEEQADNKYAAVTAKYRPQVYTTLNSHFFEVSLPFEGASTTNSPGRSVERSPGSGWNEPLPNADHSSEEISGNELSIGSSLLPASHSDAKTNEQPASLLYASFGDLPTFSKSFEPQIERKHSSELVEQAPTVNKRQLLNKRRLSENQNEPNSNELHLSLDQRDPSAAEAPVKIRVSLPELEFGGLAASKREELPGADWSSLILRKKNPLEPIQTEAQLRVASSASSAGIRVTADNSSKPLIINSRGLITAAKKGQTGMLGLSAYNSSALVSALQQSHKGEHLLSPIKHTHRPQHLTILAGNNLNNASELLLANKPNFLKRPSVSVSGTLWKEYQPEAVTIHLKGSQPGNKTAASSLQIVSLPSLQAIASSELLDGLGAANSSFGSSSSAMFQHNPPYKQSLLDTLTTPSKVVVSEAASSAMLTSAQTSLPTTSSPPKSLGAHTKRTSPMALSSTKRPSSLGAPKTRIKITGSLVAGPEGSGQLSLSTVAPAYESGELISTNPNTPISQQLNIFSQHNTTASLASTTERPPATRIKLRLQNMLLGKTPPRGASSQAQMQTQTPAPLLSSTVASNVASLLAQKLNLLNLVRPLSSGLQTGAGGFNSLFGVRVGSSASSSHNAGKLKQRVSALSGAGQAAAGSAINRRTSGVGSLLFSGFIYGLSVLPALMALTGINPLSESSSLASSASSLAANRHSSSAENQINGSNQKRRKKLAQRSPGSPAGLQAAATNPAYAFLVPLITAAANEALEEEQQDVFESTSGEQLLNLNHRLPVSASTLKSLYSPPPTILEANAIDSSELSDELAANVPDVAIKRPSGQLHSQGVHYETAWSPQVAPLEEKSSRRHRDTSGKWATQKESSLSLAAAPVSFSPKPFDDRAALDYEEIKLAPATIKLEGPKKNAESDLEQSSDLIAPLLPPLLGQQTGFEGGPFELVSSTQATPSPSSSRLLASADLPPSYQAHRQQSTSSQLLPKTLKVPRLKGPHEPPRFHLQQDRAELTLSPFHVSKHQPLESPMPVKHLEVALSKSLGFTSNRQSESPHNFRQLQSLPTRGRVEASDSSKSVPSKFEWRAISPPNRKLDQNLDSGSLLDQILERTRKMVNSKDLHHSKQLELQYPPIKRNFSGNDYLKGDKLRKNEKDRNRGKPVGSNHSG